MEPNDLNTQEQARAPAPPEQTLHQELAELDRHAPMTAALLRRAAHIFDKYHPHEVPEAVTPAGDFGFNPWTGDPVVRQFEDGSDGDAKGMRWPRQQTSRTRRAA